MKTVFAGLPFYDSLDKADRRRTRSRIPFHSPRHQLPPFLLKGTGEVTRVDLLDCEGTATEITSYFNGTTIITGWTNSGYDTFTTAGDDISALVKTTAAGVAYGYTNLFPVTSGEVIRIVLSATLTSGTAPKVVLVNNAGADISNIVTLTAGTNYVMLVSTATATEARIRIRNLNTEVFNGSVTVASSHKTALPSRFGDYLQYKGKQLYTFLPRGQWNVKITTSVSDEYFSENLVVSDIYPNIITAWTNSGYETLTTSGTTIASAINSAGDGIAHANIGGVKKGDTLRVCFNLVLNSGDIPTVYLSSTSLGGVQSNSVAAAQGINHIELTATQTLSDARLRLINNTNTNYSTSEVFVFRSYSSRFMRLDFSNTNDLGDILYQDGWSQSLWLETRLNFPLSETIEIGEEKDGVFIAEKLITKYIYRISTYISRGLHAVLMRLPQHDDITITDEVGNEYTPAVGNLQISQMDWTHFETGHIVISFNDGDNSAFGWTYDM